MSISDYVTHKITDENVKKKLRTLAQKRNHVVKAAHLNAVVCCAACASLQSHSQPTNMYSLYTALQPTPVSFSNLLQFRFWG